MVATVLVLGAGFGGLVLCSRPAPELRVEADVTLSDRMVSFLFGFSKLYLLLDDFLRERGSRDDSTIQVLIPFGAPVPPSPETSRAILERFGRRGIEFVPNRRVTSLDAGTSSAVLDDGSRMPFDLFLGIPV